MNNYWKQPGIPHKGWTLMDVIDIREDGLSEDETDYKTCMMCGNEKIRYVHVVEHNEISYEFQVGCNCAERMTEDYENPRKREKDLQNRASRLKTWTNKQWKKSQNDNYYLEVDERHVVIFKDKKTDKFKIKIDKKYSKNDYDTLEEAKIAVFKNIEYLKERGR